MQDERNNGYGATYLDNAATTALDPEVLRSMERFFLIEYGNASSIHPMGLEAENALRQARKILAGIIGAKQDEIVFTSGGTESNNLAIKGAIKRFGRPRPEKNRLITTEIEHPSVLESFRELEEQGFSVTYLPVDGNGMISEDRLREELDDRVILVSIMMVNNETGAIQPVLGCGELVRKARNGRKYPLFHVDAVQALGKLDVRPVAGIADMMSFSAHKIHGPKGVGALYVKKNTPLLPILSGGGQERGIRSGTENIPGAVGLARAAELAESHRESEWRRLAGIKDWLIDRVLGEIPNSRLNGPPKEIEASPYIVNFSFPGVPGEVLVRYLGAEGVQASTGSACSSRKTLQSHVLRAMGLRDDELAGALRLSFSRYTQQADVERAFLILKRIVEEIRLLK